MKKGFIEKVEDGKVLIVFEDKTQEEFNLSIFPENIRIDMNVIMENGVVKEICPPSDELKLEIKNLTKKLFVPFSERKQKK